MNVSLQLRQIVESTKQNALVPDRETHLNVFGMGDWVECIQVS